MGRNKTSYKKHLWSGGKRQGRASRAGLRRFYGNKATTLEEAWRMCPEKSHTSASTEEQNQPVPENPGSTGAVCPMETHEPVNPKFGRPFKTYERVRKFLQIEATLASEDDSIDTYTEISDPSPNSPGPVDNKRPIPDPLTVEDPQVEANTHDCSTSLSGYRVVDIKHVLQWASLMEKHKIECEGSVIEFVGENRSGFNSVFTFQCLSCEEVFEQSSEKEEQINKAFVWGTVTAGSDYSASAHVTRCMDIPTMSPDEYQLIENELEDVWQDHLTAEIMKTGQEEKAIAIEKGHVNEDGVPFTTVYADGGWMKRSYGHNNDSSTGMACIIGKETKKCLFLGIRNKYCYQCQFCQRMEIEPEAHACYKSFKGLSTAMEADIILLEGFKKSEEMHGLQYLFFAGNCDSSVYANLRKNVSYGSQITKIECENHAIKNNTSALCKFLERGKPSYAQADPSRETSAAVQSETDSSDTDAPSPTKLNEESSVIDNENEVKQCETKEINNTNEQKQSKIEFVKQAVFTYKRKSESYINDMNAEIQKKVKVPDQLKGTNESKDCGRI